MLDRVKKITVLLLLAVMLAGCSLGGNSGFNKDVPATLKVMYYDEGQFFQEFGMLFSTLYPNVDVQVVSTQSMYRNIGSEDEEYDPEKAFAEFIEEEQPDILMLDMTRYEKMAAEGKLYSLDSSIASNNYDTEGLVPGMVDYMKELGGGQLYGLPSGFNSQVLYYNRDLFDKYNINYPTDQMTWQEVIQLARMFPIDGNEEDRVYGLKLGYSGDVNEIAGMLANAEGLSFVNPTSKQITMNTSGWKNVLETAVDAINSGSLYYEDRNHMGFSGSHQDYLLRNPFLSGRLAMMIEGSYLINEIKQAKDYIKEEGLIVENWDMVTMPVSVQNPNQSTSTWYNNIFAVSEQSPNKDAAWAFISYITGDEYARVKSKVQNYNGFSVRTAYIKDDAGRNYEAFYKLTPSRMNESMYKDYDKLPPQFGFMFNTAMQKEFEAVQAGSKTSDEALEILQVKGEELLLAEPMTDEELNKMYMEQYADQRALMEQAAGVSVEGTEDVSTE